MGREGLWNSETLHISDIRVNNTINDNNNSINNSNNNDEFIYTTNKIRLSC